MECLNHAINMMRPGCYFASIDIKDAFYSVPIFILHKKYLKFMWRGVAYQFNVMPNGYKDAMRIFTKILKPLFSCLREMGYKSVIYVDDSLLVGQDYQECLENVSITYAKLVSLGFFIHPTKSILDPVQIIIFLGFILNSINMTVTLTMEKKQSILDQAKDLISASRVKIRTLSKFIGHICASFQAVPHGKLRYRQLEYQKIQALISCSGDYEGYFRLSRAAKRELQWWIDNIMDSYRKVEPTPQVDYTIFTDASDDGWGAHDDVDAINGRWSRKETFYHINVLELLAIKWAVLSFVPLNRVFHVRIMSDNTTAISYINKLGGSKSISCNNIAIDIWNFCIREGCHISAAHIPGIDNVLADWKSRSFHDSGEWMLDSHIFLRLCDIFGSPDIDLFASRLNAQMDTYCSWKPDPFCTHIDAMYITWDSFVYIFPPFCMIWPVIKKVSSETDKALVIVPYWPTQSWFPYIMEMIIAEPILIKGHHLSLPGTDFVHPMCPKLELVALLISRCQEKQQAFRRSPWISCGQHGGTVPTKSTMQLVRRGRSFAVGGVRIHTRQMST